MPMGRFFIEFISFSFVDKVTKFIKNSNSEF